MSDIEGQRPNCPHAPHDFSCGPKHGGICALAHQGPCEAVHPICPACFTAHPTVVVSAVAHRVAEDGFRNLSCSSCERITFHYDAELICSVCQWLVPDVNDRLAERYAANGGDYDAEPGTCPNCRQAGAGHAMIFPVTCPGCGAGHMIEQQAVSTTKGVNLHCDCGYAIIIPADVWCPGCRLNLRTLSKITEVIKKANEADRPVGDNLREPPLDRVARRAAAFANAAQHRYHVLTETQRGQLYDARHLDMLLYSDGQIADWIIDQVRLRSLGHHLNRDGGMSLMVAVADRITVLDRRMLRLVEIVWDGIGEWRK